VDDITTDYGTSIDNAISKQFDPAFGYSTRQITNSANIIFN